MRGKGHYVVICPTREQRLSLTCEASHTKVDTSHPKTEKVLKEAPEEVLEGSILPLCVICRVLTGNKTEDAVDGDWLCNNIFHTWVEHQG